MEEYRDPDKPESSRDEEQSYQNPAHLFVMRFLGTSMLLGALYNLYEKFGLGVMELLLMSKERPVEFIYGIILSGVLSFFCGIGILILSDTSRQASIVMAFSFILADIRLLISDPAAMTAGRPPLAFLNQNNMKMVLYVLIAYQVAWIWFFSKEHVRERFVFKESKGYLLVGLVFLLSIYCGWYDFSAVFRKVSSSRVNGNAAGMQSAAQQRGPAVNQPAKAGTPPPEGPKVKGILATRGNFSVMINNKFYSLGDTVCGGTIVDIIPQKISMQFQGETREFSIGSCINAGKCAVSGTAAAR